MGVYGYTLSLKCFVRNENSLRVVIKDKMRYEKKKKLHPELVI